MQKESQNLSSSFSCIGYDRQSKTIARKMSREAACVFDKEWLRRCRRLMKVSHNDRPEFAIELQELLVSHRINYNLIASKKFRSCSADLECEGSINVDRTRNFEDNEKLVRKVDVLLLTCMQSFHSTVNVVTSKSQG